MKKIFKSLICFFCGITFLVHLHSQGFSIPKSYQQLSQAIRKAESPDEKVNAYRNFSKYYAMGEKRIDSAFYYSQLIYDLGISENDSKILIEGLLSLGELESKTRKFNEANKKFKEALAIEVVSPQGILRNQIYFSIAKNYSKVERLDSSVLYYNLSLDEIKKHTTGPDSYGLSATTFSHLAMAYEDAKLFQDAEKYLLLAEENLDQLGDTIGLMAFYNLMSDFYIQAILSGEKHAIYSAKNAELEKAIGLESDYSHIYVSSVDELSVTEKVQFYQEALDVHLESSNYEMIKSCFSSLIDLHTKEEQWEEAIQIINNGLEFSKSQEAGILTDSQHLQESFLQKKLLILKKQSKFKESLHTLELINVLNDSLDRKSNLDVLQELNMQYETSKKEKEIAENKVEIARKTNQRNLIVIIGAFFTFLFYYLWNRSKQKKLISEQKQALQLQQINTLENEQKILSMSAMIEGQESERTRIAQDLHDGLGGLLSSIKTRFSLFQSKSDETGEGENFEKTTGMIDQAVTEVRRISQNLMPNSLRINGLRAGIQQLANDLEHIHGLNTTLDIVENLDSTLSNQQEISIYRIIQEACNNVVKHSEAKSLFLQLSQFQKELILIIEDDGKGFEIASDYPTIGIKSIKTRVTHLNGTIDIDSKQDQGTTITVNIPLS